jgi:hypothetical protein
MFGLSSNKVPLPETFKKIAVPLFPVNHLQAELKMDFKAGDSVRFLDEKGRGIISRFIDNKQVLVRMEDGFEIPYLLSKLVPAEMKREGTPKPGASQKTEKEVYTESVVVSKQAFSTEGVFLVYEPKDKGPPLTGNLTVRIFNMCAIHIQFTISSRSFGKFTCEFAGTLHAGQSVTIREITTADMERWAALKVDIQFFSYEPFQTRESISRLIKQKPAKFFKESSYTSGGFTATPSVVVDLTRQMQKGQEEEYFEEEDLHRIMREKETRVSKPLSISSEKNNALLEWEVDLHAEELIDNLQGMSNAQIIEIQLKYFQKRLDEGIAGNVRKIVFIHGVGNGRLKQEIRYLLANYKSLRYHDASYASYGFGATEVVL